MGKQYDKWLKVRADFLDTYPPNHQGYYACYLCPKWIYKDEVTVDHVIPRSRAPHLRYVFSNLAICCGACNTAKGSSIVKPSEPDEEEPDELEGLW